MAPLKRERSAWYVMRRRCLRPTSWDWKYYGGKGVRICPRWIESFRNFLTDMGPAPSPKHWLGRLDTSKGYSPDNCAWTTQTPQENRRGYCRKVTIDEQDLTAAMAARLPGQPTRNSVIRRQENGLPLDLPMAKLYRKSMWLTFNGETLPLPEWSRRTGLSKHALRYRIKVGMPVDLILAPQSLRRPPATPSLRLTT